MFNLGYYAAFRVSEVFHLELNDQQPSRKRLLVTIGVKNEKRRTITLPPEAQNALEYYLYSDHP